ncbi:DUF6876 family protein [Neolewinella xylanilytica]|uniref:DUF6876 family protein n=1 Tax=Neolewinella xylanilytica TaxID=1514080 RepID=UPI0011B0D2E9|nr:DUF6876 family protein [Neolewinella xylanilytica]
MKLDLQQFTGGTSTWWRNPLHRNFSYTDGVKYVAETVGAYWLIDYVFSSQYAAQLKDQPFQVWKWSANDGKGRFVVEDGNNEVIVTYNLEFTDFPDGEVTLWFTDRTLLLPNEY